jgi:hypothetical protein
MSKKFKNDKLDESWFQPDTLVYLEGSFPSEYSKKTIKNLLDGLGIKWTIKLDDGITKIISTRSIWRSNFHYTKNQKLTDLYNSLPNEKYHPRALYSMIKNMDAESLSEYSDQILSLLKNEDKVNIDLAITLIGDSLIETRWIPWMLLNKQNTLMKDLLKKNNIPLGQWNVRNTTWNFRKSIYDLKTRLNIDKSDIEEFVTELIRKEINNIYW